MTELLDLAPTHLQNYRTRRYLGDEVALAMAAFVEEDQRRIRELYTFLNGLMQAVREGSPEERLAATLRLVTGTAVEALVELATQLGRESYAAAPSPLLAKTIHDVRGGGLTPLLGQLQFLLLSAAARDVELLYFLTRDHLKIMRNALLGLDDAQREQDLTPKAHDTRLLVQKHHGAILQAYGKATRLEVECPQHVAISECCVEFGALDRILYNLLNNACRHAASGTLRLVLLPLPDGTSPENLRLVLINAVTAEDAAHLGATDLASLFVFGVSTTGSGAGLSVAGEFVANAFGLSSPAEAVSARYLGARLLGEEFAVWFHWPILAEY